MTGFHLGRENLTVLPAKLIEFLNEVFRPRYLGSYDALRRYRLEHALVDLTGGVAEVLDIGASEMTPQLKEELHNRLSDATAKGSPLCALHEVPDEVDGTATPPGRLPCGE